MKNLVPGSVGVWIALVALRVASVHAHELPSPSRALHWNNDFIAETYSFDSLGWGSGSKKIEIEGKQCLAGGNLLFDVKEAFAFDDYEDFLLELDVHGARPGSKLRILFNDARSVGWSTYTGASSSRIVSLAEKAGQGVQRVAVELSKARFANLGFEGSDIFVTSSDPYILCDVLLRRLNPRSDTQKPSARLRVRVLDENGHGTTARMAVYTADGHLPLPSLDAIAVRNGLSSRPMRVASLGGLGSHLPPWPVSNRAAFYVDGSYATRLRPGRYRIIVAKGPEYRQWTRMVNIEAEGQNRFEARLQRWTDMASKGWYSGDTHVHYPNYGDGDNGSLRMMATAEGLNVINALELDDAAGTHLTHHSWSVYPGWNEAHVVVPGQEAPRTSILGHTIQLNTGGRIRNDASYLLYHTVFEAVRDRGGLVGFAHVVDVSAHIAESATKGLALDVPFGLIDFAEVLSIENQGTSAWFDFLNLGFRLSPSAGTDYPIGGVPGAVRNYVQAGHAASPAKWFQGFKAGKTFATSGPILTLTVNGCGLGTTLRLQAGQQISVRASAALNPDFGRIDRLELIEQGAVVAAETEGADEIVLDKNLLVAHGTWFVVRAVGVDPAVTAVSAPIYISVNGDRWWKRSEVPAIAARLIVKLQTLLKDDQPNLEEGEAARIAFSAYWKAQRERIQARARQAIEFYEDLSKQAQ